MQQLGLNRTYSDDWKDLSEADSKTDISEGVQQVIDLKRESLKKNQLEYLDMKHLFMQIKMPIAF